MDRPIIMGQLYAGSDVPTFSASVDSCVEHAGVLSGYHTNNFDGSSFNRLVTDDTPGQLRTRLATSTAATELNLGYLVQHSAGSAQRGSYRGNGFELGKYTWGMLRVGESLLVSTSMRPRNSSSVTSTQLDASEAIGLMKGAGTLAKTLIDAPRRKVRRPAGLRMRRMRHCMRRSILSRTANILICRAAQFLESKNRRSR